MIDTAEPMRQIKIHFPDDLWTAVKIVASVDHESAASVVRRVLRADPAISRALLTVRDQHTESPSATHSSDHE